MEIKIAGVPEKEIKDEIENLIVWVNASPKEVTSFTDYQLGYISYCHPHDKDEEDLICKWAERGTQFLETLLKHHEPVVRVAALMAIEKLRETESNPSIINLITDAFKDSDPYVRSKVICILLEFDPNIDDGGVPDSPGPCEYSLGVFEPFNMYHIGNVIYCIGPIKVPEKEPVILDTFKKGTEDKEPIIRILSSFAAVSCLLSKGCDHRTLLRELIERELDSDVKKALKVMIEWPCSEEENRS